ncbi:MAG: hypothetical protein Q6J44_04910 [Gloeomargarita sp. DG02_4_bins_56]
MSWMPPLNLSLGLWRGEPLGQNSTWLRWWNGAGNLLLWSGEQAKQERPRAEPLAAKPREWGIAPGKW